MARLALDDLKRTGWKAVSGATGDDITTASGTSGAIRIMAACVSHTANATLSVDDAATYDTNEFQVKCLANSTGFISFAPHGYRVSYISTSLTGGEATIWYVEDETGR